MIGFVYKIFDNTNGNVYYGSTKETISRRISRHRSQYNEWIGGKRRYGCKSFDILKNNDYSYSLVEKVEYEDKMELLQRERWCIENNECVNKCVPLRSPEERIEYHKEYRENNREQNIEYQKEHYQKNKERINEQQKEYREDNKELVTEQKKEYYEKNKVRLIAKQKEYNQQNKGKKAEYDKEHYQANKEKKAEYNKEYYQKKKAETLILI